MKNYEIHDFYCTCCGNKGICLPRLTAKHREKGHLKKIYCLYCKTETNFAEIKNSYTKEKFQEEFRLGRFIGGNRIEIKDLKSCGKVDCKYNKDGKCWNANNSREKGECLNEI